MFPANNTYNSDDCTKPRIVCFPPITRITLMSTLNHVLCRIKNKNGERRLTGFFFFFFSTYCVFLVNNTYKSNVCTKPRKCVHVMSRSCQGHVKVKSGIMSRSSQGHVKVKSRSSAGSPLLYQSHQSGSRSLLISRSQSFFFKQLPGKGLFLTNHLSRDPSGAG